MVDFANKPIATPNFHFISPLDTVRLAAKSKRQFLAKNHHQILHFFVADFLGKKWFKNQTSALIAILKAIPWYLFGIFSLAIFAGRASSNWLVRARKEFWVIELHRGRLLFPFHYVLGHLVLPAKYCIYCFVYKSKLTQIVLVGPGIRLQNGLRDDFSREASCLLWSM